MILCVAIISPFKPFKGHIKANRMAFSCLYTYVESILSYCCWVKVQHLQMRVMHYIYSLLFRSTVKSCGVCNKCVRID